MASLGINPHRPRQIHWFNPENDLALAAGKDNYTPPAAAIRLRDAGAALPLWYGTSGDAVLAHGINAEWLRHIQNDFDIDTSIFNGNWNDSEPSPWGWSAYTVHTLKREGCPGNILPSHDAIAAMRMLSNRATAVKAAQWLGERTPEKEFLFGSKVINDENQLASTVEEMRHSYFVKMPWSSSGRGVASSISIGTKRAYRFACDSIRKQGSVIIEPYHDKALDFAQLYKCQDGNCEFVGTSIFATDRRGAYSGNVLGNEAILQEKLNCYCSLSKVHLASNLLQQYLKQEIAPHYSGIVGIDMLVDKSGKIDPVVEINLRTTMGYVAHRFAKRFLAPCRTGIMRIMPVPCHSPADYQVENGRLMEGCLYLIPPSLHFTISATITKS